MEILLPVVSHETPLQRKIRRLHKSFLNIWNWQQMPKEEEKTCMAKTSIKRNIQRSESSIWGYFLIPEEADKRWSSWAGLYKDSWSQEIKNGRSRSTEKGDQPECFSMVFPPDLSLSHHVNWIPRGSISKINMARVPGGRWEVSYDFASIVTWLYFCHILQVRTESQCQPRLKGRGYIVLWILRVMIHGEGHLLFTIEEALDYLL